MASKNETQPATEVSSIDGPKGRIYHEHIYKILDMDQVKMERRFRVQWKGNSEADSTWERESHLVNCKGLDRFIKEYFDRKRISDEKEAAKDRRDQRMARRMSTAANGTPPVKSDEKEEGKIPRTPKRVFGGTSTAANGSPPVKSDEKEEGKIPRTPKRVFGGTSTAANGSPPVKSDEEKEGRIPHIVGVSYGDKATAADGWQLEPLKSDEVEAAEYATIEMMKESTPTAVEVLLPMEFLQSGEEYAIIEILKESTSTSVEVSLPIKGDDNEAAEHAIMEMIESTFTAVEVSLPRKSDDNEEAKFPRIVSVSGGTCIVPNRSPPVKPAKKEAARYSPKKKMLTARMSTGGPSKFLKK